MKNKFYLFPAILVALALALSGLPALAGGGHDCGCNCKHDQVAKAKPPKAFDKAPKVGTKATCPVMGSEFTVDENTTRSEYKGKHYVFCCPGCKPKFDKDPAKYAK